jgi:hypothetical protein
VWRVLRHQKGQGFFPKFLVNKKEFSGGKAIVFIDGKAEKLKKDRAMQMDQHRLPGLPPERFQFIGNRSLSGARMAVVSNHALEKAHDIGKRMTYFELSIHPDFMDEFIAALFLPHTNRELFPPILR